MPTKKGKTISFDAMVKFFMQNYNIPTKKDVDKVMAKLDRLESLIEAAMASGGYPVKGHVGPSKTAVTAVDMVFDAIKRSRQGIEFSDIQAKTDLEIKRFAISFFD